MKFYLHVGFDTEDFSEEEEKRLVVIVIRKMNIFCLFSFLCSRCSRKAEGAPQTKISVAVLNMKEKAAAFSSDPSVVSSLAL